MRKKAAALVIALAAAVLVITPVTAQASPAGASIVSTNPASGCVGSRTGC
ncbi:hypothetical protein AB0M80_18480 [Amycolatopsis sp. NPDC051045]